MATDTTGTRTVHNTLSTTVVDTVTLQGHWNAVEITNRTAAGGAAIWATVDGTTPTTAGNECFYVPAGTSLVIEMPNGAAVQPVVKLLGSANDYSVVGLTGPSNGRSVLV